MNRLPPQLSPPRLVAGLVVPLAAYLVIRAVIGSATAARILVIGTGLVITANFIRDLKVQRR